MKNVFVALIALVSFASNYAFSGDPAPTGLNVFVNSTTGNPVTISFKLSSAVDDFTATKFTMSLDITRSSGGLLGGEFGFTNSSGAGPHPSVNFNADFDANRSVSGSYSTNGGLEKFSATVSADSTNGVFIGSADLFTMKLYQGSLNDFGPFKITFNSNVSNVTTVSGNYDFGAAIFPGGITEFSFTAVPEPSSMIAGAFAFGCITFRQIRKRRSSKKA